MNEKPNRVELTYHEAYEKSLEYTKKYPDHLPIELNLEVDGLWIFRLMNLNQKTDKEISGLIYEFILNPDK